MVADVIQLNDSVAGCPECGSDAWYIKIDGFGNNWKHILGTECIECGFTVNFPQVKDNAG